MSEPELRGVFTVLSTPFNDDDSIDLQTLSKEIEWLIQQGVDGFVLAMVSEVLRLSAAERSWLTEKVCDLTAGRVPVVASVGAESTKVAIELAKSAEKSGAAALMATPPIAFPSSSLEIIKYYKSIIENVSIPLIVQDASNYVGQPLEISLYVELINQYGNDRVQFKPEAKPVVERLKQLKLESDGRAKVFEGQGGAELMGTFPIGIVGTMPGAEIPWALVSLWKALTSGNLERAAQIHNPLAKLIELQTTLDAYVAVEKYLLVKQGVFKSSRQRGPVGFNLDQKLISEIDLRFSELEKVVRA
jgi:4-hydroxy-tetrahydrodipicolinate synthase